MTNKGKIKTMFLMKIKTEQLVLQDSYSVSPSVKHFKFNCSEDLSTQYMPGQFITIQFMVEDKILRRSYSIANTSPNGSIEFAAGYVDNGPASKRLFALKIGDPIQADGPFGRLILKEEPVERYLLIATSTGITPYRAMLDTLSQKLIANPKLSVHILQGVRSQADLLYKEDFLSFTQKHPNAHFHACYSREENQTLNTFEFKGYVQDKLKTLTPNPQKDIAYLCGNPEMVDVCHKLLIDDSFNIKQIRREKYISK